MGDQPDINIVPATDADAALKPAEQDAPQPAFDQVHDALGMEARTMARGILLPTEGPLSPDQRDAVQGAVRAHVRAHGLKLGELGQKTGVTKSVISQTLSGNYAGDVDGVLRRLNSWIEDDEIRRRKTKPIGMVDTCVVESVRTLAKYARSNSRVAGSGGIANLVNEAPRIVLGYGPSGCGKSIAAAALHADDPLSILIRIGDRPGTAGGIINAITDVAGFRGALPRGDALRHFVFERLRDSNRLLVVDEAHRLKLSGCECLRDLTDVCGIPIVLLATEELAKRITTTRSRCGLFAHEQFARRIGLQINLIRGADGRGGVTRPVYSIAEVQSIFRQSMVRITPDGIQFLRDIACVLGWGMLGLARQVFENAKRTAERKGGAIDERLLRASLKRSMVALGEDGSALLSVVEMTVTMNREIAATA